MRVLIAEDDSVSRDLLSAVLNKAGHEVIVTTDGLQAWEVMREPGAPRLAILDWLMPGMDGLEVLKRIRARSSEHIPYIIMLTCKTDKADIIAGLGAGASDYLTKPFNVGELLARIEVGQRMVEMKKSLDAKVEELRLALQEQSLLLKSLRRSKELLSKSQEIARIGSWELEPGTEGLIWSDEFYRILGIDPRNIEPAYELFLESVHPEDRDTVHAVHSAHSPREENGYELEYRILNRSSGETRFVHEKSVNELDASGKVIRSIGMIMDITEQKRAREEREKLQSQLYQAQKMESIGTLTGGISHDFNNLLQAMSGNIELLLANKSQDHPEVNRLRTVEKLLSRSAGLIRQLLTFSRKAEPVRQLLDLNQEILSAVKILERTIPKMVRIEVHTRDHIRLVHADSVQIEQILLNLGINAADAMPGGGRLTFETRNIDLDEQFSRTHPRTSPGKYVLLMVSDTGRGMDKTTQNHIFDPFFTTKDRGKGTGLGLATVYGIVKSHGGHITCYSEIGQGTTFKIYLPAAKQEQEDETRKEPPATVSVKGTETILVVDDDQEILEVTAEGLNDWGYQVLGAASGEQALEIYQQNTSRIDLVLMDLNMPGMGGYRSMQRMMDINPQVRVLITTGYSITQAAQPGKPGAAGIICKPFQLKELMLKIREILDSVKNQ